MENEVFATAIEIRKVRHLENIKIEISETERKHLILTGKNGSGKTSVLEAVRDFFVNGFEHQYLKYVEDWQKSIERFKIAISQLEVQLKTASGEYLTNIKKQINSYEDSIKQHQAQIDSFKNPEIFFSSFIGLIKLYDSNEFLLSYFDSKRSHAQKPNQPFFDKVSGLKKIDFKKKYGLKEKIGNLFVQHLLNLYVDLIEAEKFKETETVNQIENWFQRFESSLQEVLDEPNLQLAYNRQERTYEIKLGNGLTVDFNALSDGFSSIMIIVAELIMRMESMNARNYDLQGIVLIDEIETHLHIDLQKKILPFLTTFFPKIQFIVTTHSPFVLNSIPNAVVFDLEKQIRMEDAYQYSAAGIVEGYFEDEEYSLNPTQLEKELKDYENLVQKTDRTEEESEKMLNLRRKFKNIPENLALDILSQFQQIELKRLTAKP